MEHGAESLAEKLAREKDLKDDEVEAIHEDKTKEFCRKSPSRTGPEPVRTYIAYICLYIAYISIYI